MRRQARLTQTIKRPSLWAAHCRGTGTASNGIQKACLVSRPGRSTRSLSFSRRITFNRARHIKSSLIRVAPYQERDCRVDALLYPRWMQEDKHFDGDSQEMCLPGNRGPEIRHLRDAQRPVARA